MILRRLTQSSPHLDDSCRLRALCISCRFPSHLIRGFHAICLFPLYRFLLADAILRDFGFCYADAIMRYKRQILPESRRRRPLLTIIFLRLRRRPTILLVTVAYRPLMLLFMTGLRSIRHHFRFSSFSPLVYLRHYYLFKRWMMTRRFAIFVVGDISRSSLRRHDIHHAINRRFSAYSRSYARLFYFMHIKSAVFRHHSDADARLCN